MCSPVNDRIRLNLDKALNECRSVLVIANRILLNGDTLAVRCSRLTKEQNKRYFNKDQLNKAQTGCALEDLDISHLHANIRAFGGLTTGCHLEVCLKKFKDIRNDYEHGKHILSLDKNQLKTKLDELLKLCIDILNELKNSCGSPADIRLIDHKIADIGTRLDLLKDTLEDELHEKAEEMKGAATQLVKCSNVFDQKIQTLTQVTKNATLQQAELVNTVATIDQSVGTLTQVTENATLQQADLKNTKAIFEQGVSDMINTAAIFNKNFESLTKITAENTARQKELMSVAKKITQTSEKIDRNVENLNKTVQNVAKSFETQAERMYALDLNHGTPQTKRSIDEDMSSMEKNKSMNTYMYNGLVPYSDSDESLSDPETPPVEKKGKKESDLFRPEQDSSFDLDEDIIVLKRHGSNLLESEPFLHKPDYSKTENQSSESFEEDLKIENDRLKKENEDMKRMIAEYSSMLLLDNNQLMSEHIPNET